MNDIEFVVTCRCGRKASTRIAAKHFDEQGVRRAFVHILHSDGWRQDDVARLWRCPRCAGEPRDERH